MNPDHKLTELLDTATTDVPAVHLAPPFAVIHDRIRRRRRMFGAVSAAAVAMVLAGGYSVGQRMLTEPAPGVPTVPGASHSVASAPAMPWVSAVVGRDDATITVYGGANGCKELDQPRARIVAQDSARVTIEVTGRVVPAGDCSTGGRAVPIVVTLPGVLGERKLVDVVGLRSHPTYFERYLPNLGSDGRWSPFAGSWQSDDANWYQGYNGPGGSTLDLRAQPSGSVQRPDPVGTVDFGPYAGTITGNSATWTVWWEVGGATYSLRLVPAEGRSLTLANFKQEISRLWI